MGKNMLKVVWRQPWCVQVTTRSGCVPKGGSKVVVKVTIIVSWLAGRELPMRNADDEIKVA